MTAQSSFQDAFRHIVMRTDPVRLFELYYWSQDRDLFQAYRTIATLPDAARETLTSFLALVQDPEAVIVTWEPNGRLSLEARHVGQTLAMVHYMVEAGTETTATLEATRNVKHSGTP